MDIRRFFAPSKPLAQKPVQNGSLSTDNDKKKKNKSLSSEEDVKKKKKNGLKITSPKSEEKTVSNEKKRKKRAIIESDSEDEKPEKKTKKPPKESQKSPEANSFKKKDPVQYVSETDSDSDDHFVSLKKSSKPKENGTAKPAKKQEPEKTQSGVKNATKSPQKPTTAPARDKGSVKSPPVPVTPKAPAPQPKRTPTSVADYFGGAGVQRSDKKLVASVKRKTPIQDADQDELTDEFLAQQLQLEEDMELEKQIHEDEEFARTLAMHDAEPHAKKARKDSASHSTTSPKKSVVDSAHSSSTLPSLSNEESSYTEDVVGPTPQKAPLPTKPSSKLAMMKQRKEEEGEKEGGKKEEKKVKAALSPKKEPLTPTSTDRTKPRTGSVTTTTATPTTFKTSPKKSTSTSPDDGEKKRGNSVAFRNYLNREGPRALGSKEIPQGAENCLEGCVFVITGVLESLERDEAKVLIERHGGKVTGNISKKTSYLVLGRDSGVSKTEKAHSLGTKILDEDGLLELIRTKPGKKSKYEVAAEAENKASNSRTPDSRKTTPRSLKASPVKSSPSTLKASPVKSSPSTLKGSPVKSSPRTLKGSPARSSPSTLRGSPAKFSPRTLKGSPARSSPRTPKTPSPSKAGRRLGSEVRRGLSLEGRGGSTSSSQGPSPSSSSPSLASEGASLLWVDKYRPRSLKSVIGQTGELSCANKLLRWLQNWHRHHAGGGAKPAAARFGKFNSAKDDGSSYKAALLSGPPGVGKTTTAVLVCEELGYSYVEMNASCTRSKKNLKEVIAESLNNTSIKNFYTGSSQTVSSKHVLIMDEVDGMAGNEDRGGIQEMIGLIKQSKIPIICMCNDRNHQKIRSLANYCFDLRFQRPRVEQIKGAMMSIAFKEGIKVPPPALNEIILASNHDIRQVLHNLCMWSATDKVMTYDQATQDAKSARKDTKLGPFDVCRQVFSTESARMSLIDKSDLFFHDYSLGPLFVQENYPHVRPAAASGNLKSHLVLLSKTADSICDGDLVDRQIRSRQAWNLLPTQAIYASVLPGELMRGYMSQFPSFPSWLGKFSSTGKHSRITQELTSHMSLKTLSGRQAVNQDYLPYLRGMLLSPLQRQGAEGAAQAVQLMDQYHLVREDVDNIMEISVWGGQTDPYAKLDPKVKAAFTRAYNREVHLTPYSLQAIKKGRRGGGAEPDLGEGETEQESQEVEEEEEGLGADAMIKQKKSKPGKESKEKKPGGSGRGKEPKEKKAGGPARGRGRGNSSKK